MSGPTIQRDGDTWALAWESEGIGMGLERLAERRDELRAEITVESKLDGRVIGPVNLNLLSSESQTRFANACSKRVNGLSPERWHGLVVHACAVVAKQYRAPTPTVDLSTVEDSGPVEYLIPGLVPTDETTVAYGDGESCKSLLVLMIAFCVATGRELPWGPRPTKVGNVLFLDWETNVRTVASRLRRIALGELADVPKIHYRQCFRSITDELPNIREEVSRKKIDLVITDSIGFAASGALVEDETARTCMNALRNLSPATRLVVAHVSKESAQAAIGPVKPFGSAFFWNGMRSGIEVRRADDQANSDVIDLGLYHRKANDGEHQKPFGLQVAFDGRGGAIQFRKGRLDDTPDLAARTSLSARIRGMLRQGAKATDAIADELDVKEATVRATIARMGDVVRLDDGTAGGRGNVARWGLASE